MAGYNIVFRQRDFTIAAGITNVKSTLYRTWMNLAIPRPEWGQSFSPRPWIQVALMGTNFCTSAKTLDCELSCVVRLSVQGKSSLS